jgi:hypothetical protein
MTLQPWRPSSRQGVFLWSTIERLRHASEILPLLNTLRMPSSNLLLSSQLLGPTEFEVRDLCHKIGAKAVETALLERKKGGM